MDLDLSRGDYIALAIILLVGLGLGGTTKIAVQEGAFGSLTVAAESMAQQSASGGEDNDLEAYYRFDTFSTADGGNNTLVDQSTSGNDLAASGVELVEGRYGKAASFDEHDQAISRVPEGLDVRNISIAFWLRPGTGEGDRWKEKIIHKYSESPGIPYLVYGGRPNESLAFMREEKLPEQPKVHKKLESGPMKWSPDGWHHVVFIHAGKNWTMYLNGSLYVQWPGGRMDVDTDPGPFVLGGSRFDGAIDDLRIYSRALTLTEVRKVMRNRRITDD